MTRIVLSTLLTLISAHSLAADQGETIHVHPGKSIQAALERAAEEGIGRVIVHAGTYRPPSPRQAMIWFNARHNGITLEAKGEVILTAANPDLADPSAPSLSGDRQPRGLLWRRRQLTDDPAGIQNHGGE